MSAARRRDFACHSRSGIPNLDSIARRYCNDGTRSPHSHRFSTPLSQPSVDETSACDSRLARMTDHRSHAPRLNREPMRHLRARRTER